MLHGQITSSLLLLFFQSSSVVGACGDLHVQAFVAVQARTVFLFGLTVGGRSNPSKRWQQTVPVGVWTTVFEGRCDAFTNQLEEDAMNVSPSILSLIGAILTFSAFLSNGPSRRSWNG